MSDRIVYKLMSAAELQQMQRDGVFHGSPADIADGYIHLSCDNTPRLPQRWSSTSAGSTALCWPLWTCRRLEILCAGSPHAADSFFRTSMVSCRSKRWYRSQRWSEPLMGGSSCPLRAWLPCPRSTPRSCRNAKARAIRRALRGNGWVAPAGSPPGKVGAAAAVMGDIAHRGTNEPARQDARARLPSGWRRRGELWNRFSDSPSRTAVTLSLRDYQRCNAARPMVNAIGVAVCAGT